MSFTKKGNGVNDGTIKLGDKSSFNPTKIGKVLRFKVISCGEGDWITMPKYFNVTCHANNCHLKEKDIDIIELVDGTPTGIAEYFGNNLKDLKQRIIKRYYNDTCPSRNKKHNLFVDPKEWIGCQIFLVRDLPESSGLVNPIYKYTPLYIVGDKCIEFEDRKKYVIEAVPIPELKTKKLGLYLKDFKPLHEDWKFFTPTQKEKNEFDEYFTFDSYDDLKYIIDRSIATEIVQTEHAKLTSSLVLHSPMWNDYDPINPQNTRGWMRAAFYGDTKTGKGSILRYITETLGLGERCVGETTSRTGLLYFIDNNRNIILWGILVLNDGGFVSIEGLHGVYASEMAQHREALETGIVTVDRSIKGQATLRTRIICDMNPNQPMAVEGIYRVQALFDLPSFSHSADITRWDIWVPFFHGQASHKEIAHAAFHKPEIPINVFRKHVLLAWRPLEQRWEDGVVKKASNVAERFMKNYSSVKIPLINNNFRNYLLRLTASFSQLLNSYNKNYTKLIVKEGHVDYAEIFMIENIQLNEYDMYVNEEKTRFELKDDEISMIVGRLNKNDLKILKEIKMESLSSSIIGERVGLAQQTVKSRMKRLKSLNLISSGKGRSGGYTLTARGIKLMKLLSQDRIMTKKIKTTEDIEKLGEIVRGKCRICDTVMDLTYIYEGHKICEGCAQPKLIKGKLKR